MSKKKKSTKKMETPIFSPRPTKRTQIMFIWMFCIVVAIISGIFITGYLKQSNKTSQIILSGLSGNNRVALTVNIGSSASTQQIVALSNAITENKIPCTFFISKTIAEDLSPIWRAQIMNGNEIDYYYDGSDFNSISDSAITNSFSQWEASVSKNIGSNLSAKYIRADDSYDYKNIYVQTALYSKNANLIGWTVEFKDMSNVPEESIKEIINNEIIDGAIIKMDISDFNTSKLIKMLSEEATKKKLKFVNLNLMFEP